MARKKAVMKREYESEHDPGAYMCPVCKEPYLMEAFSFCPMCGARLVWPWLDEEYGTGSRKGSK